ncbi:hypothetical protein CRYUN_Cryun37aG0054800 [Craigia yunnanensis]
MEMLNIFFCALIGCSILAVLVHAQDQSGFISIDCGISAASTYNDATTGIKYISDATIIDSGVSKSISPQFQSNTLEQQFYSVRSFPEGVRNCYTLKPTQGRNNKFLIRASFMYGNYDDRSKPPEFDLHLGVNFWDYVKIDNESSIVTKEIMHVSPASSISVCLINKGLGTPFMSTLELRHFRNSTYPTPYEALELYRRLYVGSIINETIRYNDDAYDRIWKSSNFPGCKTLSTSLAIDARDNNGYQLASAVMSTAHTPINASIRLGFHWEPTDPKAKYFVYMHFAEVEELKANEIREFNITQNGKFLYAPVVPEYLYTNTLYTTEPVSGDNIQYWLERTNRSTLPPILNALEVFMVKDFSVTNRPKRCYEGSDPLRILSLNLSSSELTGKLAASISNLAMLQQLDLSNNSLTGDVPDFLSKMPFLSILNLKGNKLSGSLPVELLERSNNGSLLLSVGENPDLCPSASCQKKEKHKNKFVVPLAASAATVFVIFAALAAFWSLRRRKQEAVKMLSESSAQGYKEFHAEVKVLPRVHHGNLTNLVRYCNEGSHMGLIYEYMANGNLKQHLSGLEYLHYGCSPPIVHRDVKSANILLNEKFQAKLADFALSRIFPAEGGVMSQQLLLVPQATLTPSKYQITNWLNEKSDVYSFGVVLLDIVTSRPVITISDDEVTHISQWVNSLLAKGEIKRIVDQSLGGDFEINSAWTIVELALGCASRNSTDRPTMSEVVMELRECLKKEVAGKREGPGRRSIGPREGISINLDTEPSPRARHNCIGFVSVSTAEKTDVDSRKIHQLQDSSKNRQFTHAQVEHLLRVHHRNLTTFIGYCDDGINMGLIYEYMAKGNLAEHLKDSSRDVLNWEGRLGIALEAAQGLEYLHNGCIPPIIHRDVKSTNILLTESLHAKLSDFGYSISNRLTEKSDVYSFGVVLLEIITSRPVSTKTYNQTTHISQWVSFMLSNGDIKTIVDPRLQGDFDITSMRKAVELAMACVSPTSTKRPTMNYVVTKLKIQMGMRRHFLLFSSFALAALIHAQDQSGFISLDCGLPEGSRYNDTTTGINYISDTPYIQTGISNRLPDFNSGMQQQLLEYLRSFPEGDRNCYMLNLGKGDRYLIRTSFMYGNYDEKNEAPEFDLHLGPNLWAPMVFKNASTVIVKEIIHVLQSNYLHVCLVNIGKGTPFISALELRLLKNSTYITVSETEALEFFLRNDFGSTSNSTFRFPEDVYDRIWQPYQRNDLGQISTSSSLLSNSDFEPPLLAMRTASTPANASQPLNFSVQDSDSNAQFYFFMHLVELEELQANQSREFITYLNDKLWLETYSPVYLRADTARSLRPVKGGQFSMVRTRGSTQPPILNALEAYKVKELVQSQTVERDVKAIMNIKSMYGLKRNWEGDPCAPQEYSWEGLNCSYEDSNPPRIISLNLSSSGLSGEIPPYIVNLTQLQYLDLSTNNLTGAVPEFLTRLQSLTLLNLQGNALNGSVPTGLIDRSNRGLLQLNVEGNQIPCTWESCTTTTKKNNSVVVPVVASVASVLSLLIIVSALLWWLKRTKPSAGKMVVGSRKPYEKELKNRQFTYSDVERITNNFERAIGKGGFGTVYHGCLDDTQVAVKMLSKSSIQGYKQFEAEVELLLRVHHRNLTTLIGYCDDGTNMGLIYEYMAKGNLAEYLSDSGTSVLNWEGRLGIALEAAQGLEYLHHGCKPPIIHRDVKSTNILLTENLQAKLSDFGLSKSFEGGSYVSTVVAGTPGYLDPEYSTSNRLTEKSDVYSFGVVLLEIITNRPVISRTIDEAIHISHWVGSMLSNGDIENIVDSKLQGDFEINSVWKAIEVAMACLSPASTKRPTMNYVVMVLSECLIAEINRTRGVNEDESQVSIGMVSLNFGSDITPLAR